MWLAEGLAVLWGLNSAALGIEEMGWEMAPADAVRLQFPGKDVLLDYVRRSFAVAVEEHALDGLDDQQFQELRLHDWAPNQTVGNFVMGHFVHEREHYGIMLYMQGLHGPQQNTR